MLFELGIGQNYMVGLAMMLHPIPHAVLHIWHATGYCTGLLTVWSPRGNPGMGRCWDTNFVSGLHPAAQSDIGEQQWVTGIHCVWSVAGWLIVYQFGILSLSCSQYSQTICLSRWDDNACLGVRNTCSIGAWPNSLDRRPPWYCTVSLLLQTNKQLWIILKWP